jgi:hypothetical protein
MTLLNWLKRQMTKHARRGVGDAEPPHVHLVADDDAEVDPYDPFPASVVIEITDVFDLHTIPPRDVKRVVEEYLLEAYAKGFRSVRLIHGKGRGVQRETVRRVLARMPFVVDWTDAPPQAGGFGATIAHLKQTDGL